MSHRTIASGTVYFLADFDDVTRHSADMRSRYGGRLANRITRQNLYDSDAIVSAGRRTISNLGATVMRYVIGCASAVLLVGGIAFTQDGTGGDTSSASLRKVLAAEKVLAYRSDANYYDIKVIPENLAQASRDYYSEREANQERYRELQRSVRGLEGNPRLHNEDRRQLEAELRKVSRPTGIYRVGEVTRVGADFLGIRELEGATEVLIPLRQVKRVLIELERVSD